MGNNKSGIKDNNPKVSFGGKLVLDLISEGKYCLVNSLEKCVGGPFTRVEPNNPNVKSCLDLVIVSKGLVVQLGPKESISPRTKFQFGPKLNTKVAFNTHHHHHPPTHHHHRKLLSMIEGS